MFKPFCANCFSLVGHLNFQCDKCDKMELILNNMKRHEEELNTMAHIVAVNIMENYEHKKRIRMQSKSRKEYTHGRTADL